MKEQFSRTEMLIGKTGLEALKNARVAVFGIGGVGGHAAEALVRSGVGHIDIIDNDVVAESNINRQIFALKSTVGRDKVEAAKERLLDINPDVKINTFKVFYSPETSHLFDFNQYDYVVDAIDSITGKIEIVMQAQSCNVPVISSMGAGNKLNPEMFEVADIYKTSVCPLAKVMRHELKKRNVKKLKVVFSKETPIKSSMSNENKRIPASIAFVPSVAGLIIAGEVVKDLIGDIWRQGR